MFLGIDGGGTKTEIVLTDVSGLVKSHIVGPCSNPGELSDLELYENIKKSLVKVFKSESDCRNFSGSVFAGISGAGLIENRNRLEKIFTSLLPNATEVKIRSDALNVVSATLGDNDGVIAIAGTGSCVFAQKNKVLKRFGGWGYLIKDPASAFEIGREALEHLLNVEEGLAEKTILSATIEDRIGYICDQNLGRVYEGGKSFVASVAPSVTTAATLGCSEAERIIEDNCRYFVKQICAAVDYVGGNAVDVAFAGGVLEKSDIVKATIIKYLPGNINIISCDRPVIGAVLMSAEDVVKDKNTFLIKLRESLLENN